MTDFPSARGEAKWPVSVAGIAAGCPMTWSRDASRIYFFINPRMNLWVVDVETTGPFGASKPRGSLHLDRRVSALDAAPDGRLLAWWQVGEPTSQPIRVTLNALGEIRAEADGAED